MVVLATLLVHMDFLTCSWFGVLPRTISISNHCHRTYTLYLCLAVKAPRRWSPSLWVPYLPSISLAYWSSGYRILVSCSPEPSATSVYPCFLECSPRATWLLWLGFIPQHRVLVLPYRCVPYFWHQWTGAWLWYGLYFDWNRYSALIGFEFLDYYIFSRSRVLTSHLPWG